MQQKAKTYRVHPISTQSAGKLSKAYKRHGVDVYMPSYEERCVWRSKVVERRRFVAPGYAMIETGTHVDPSTINEQEGKTIIRPSIGAMSESDLVSMHNKPAVDLVPSKKKFKPGDHIMIKGVELTGRVKHLTGTEAVVVLDQTFLGAQRVCKVAFDNLEYYQSKPGS